MKKDKVFQKYLKWSNELNQKFGGKQVSWNILDHRNQWFLYSAVTQIDNGLPFMLIGWCQGRNIGKINSPGGYTIVLGLTGTKSFEELIHKIKHLDPVIRREWEEQQPDYIHLKKLKIAQNRKIGAAKRSATMAVKAGKSMPEKARRTLEDHNLMDEWIKDNMSKIGEGIVVAANNLKKIRE